MMAQRIKAGAANMGIDLPESVFANMALYWERVIETNTTLNLTRIVKEEEACNMHFLDSLAPLQCGFDMIGEGATVLDVGTGAGFPGVPIALARPDVSMTLIDARRKRVDFIAKALSDIEPAVRLLHCRAEDMKDCFDVVLARAVASGSELVRLLLPLVKPGGIALLWKGPKVFDEMERIKKESSRFGGCLLEPFTYEIPNQFVEHCLIPIEKSR